LLSKTVESSVSQNLKIEVKKCRNQNQWGDNNPFWHGGRTITPDGYIRVLYREHPRADINGYIFKHILVYEKHYKCCIPKWGVVHHINHIKSDNRIENLQGMTKAEHTRHHRVIDVSDRKCSKCGSMKSTRKGKTDYRPRWYHSFITHEWLCHNCYTRE
jgi:hypothetical protein